MARSLIAMALVLLACSVSKAEFTTLDDEAADFSRLSLGDYVRRLETAASQTSSGSRLLTDHLHYYRTLHTQGSLTKSVGDAAHGTHHDCVPFELQPALFKATASEVHEAHSLMMKATGGGASSVCPDQHVLLPRPIVIFSFDSPNIPTFAGVPRKRAPSAAGLQNMLHHSEETTTVTVTVNTSTTTVKEGKGTGPSVGYSYVDVNKTQVSLDTVSTHTILGVGPEVGTELAQIPTDGNRGVAHSINQMWWVEVKKGHHYVNATLEAGWIASRYWAVKPTTSIFMFSTPNGYTGNPDNVNDYNDQGGFVYYPGDNYHIAPGQSVDNVQFLFNYTKMPDNAGYRMDLRYFQSTLGQGYIGQFEFNETAIPYGHWPMKRYLTHGYKEIPSLNYLLTGQEIDQAYNATTLTAAGCIFGWGTNTIHFAIHNAFYALGVLDTIKFDYNTNPSFATGKPYADYARSYFVQFSGTTCGNYCQETESGQTTSNTTGASTAYKAWIYVGVTASVLFGLAFLGALAHRQNRRNKNRLPQFTANLATRYSASNEAPSVNY